MNSSKICLSDTGTVMNENSQSGLPSTPDLAWRMVKLLTKLTKMWLSSKYCSKTEPDTRTRENKPYQIKNQIRWANTLWGKFADWLKTLKLWGQKRPLRKRWQWCWREQKCLLLNCWRGWWWVIHFHFLLFDHKEREKRKARSSRKVEHRKEISTSSLPVSDQHSSCRWSFQWFPV